MAGRVRDRARARVARIGYHLNLVPAGVGGPQVLDWSGWRPTDAQLQQMRQAGIIGCQRYETDDNPSNQWKVCSKGEYDRILGAGLSILAGFEVGKTSWQGGYNLGVAHGRMARAKWRAKGHPDSRPIAFAVDSDVLPSQIPVALDYLRGCSDGTGCGPQMAYGEADVIDAAVRAGIVRLSWDTAAQGWSGHPASTAALRQLTSKSYPQFPPTQYDENNVLAADWGQHPYGGPTPPPPGKASYLLLGDD